MSRAAQNAGMYYARQRNRLAVLADDLSERAWGTILFATNPSATNTVTIGGTVVTFSNSVAPLVGLTLAASLANLLAFLTASVDTGLRKAIYSVEGNALMVLSSKEGDNTVTIAASNATASGSTLVRTQSRQRVVL